VPRDVAAGVLSPDAVARSRAVTFSASTMHVGAPTSLAAGSAPDPASARVGIEPFSVFEARAWALAAAGGSRPSSSRRVFCAGFEIDYYVDIFGGQIGEATVLRCYVSGWAGDNGLGRVYGTAGDGALAAAHAAVFSIGAQIRDAAAKLDAASALHTLQRDPRLAQVLLAAAAWFLRGTVRIVFYPPFAVAAAAAAFTTVVAAMAGPAARQRKLWATLDSARAIDEAAQRAARMKADDWIWRSTYSSAGHGSGPQEQPRQKQKSPPKSGFTPPPVNENNFYEVLKVSPSATMEEISAAFRRELLIYHPDHAAALGLDESAASERTRIIIRAYGELRNSKKRANYDAQRRK
jgi:DnaJ-domain-containing protein 1